MLDMTARRATLIKGVLVLIFAATLCTQVLSFTVANALATPLPPENYPAALYSTLIVAAAMNVQVVLVSIWQLLNVPSDSQTGDAVMRPMRTMTRAGVGTLLATAVLVGYTAVSYGMGLPSLLLVCAGAFVVAALFTVLIVTLNHVFRATISMRSELEGVI